MNEHLERIGNLIIEKAESEEETLRNLGKNIFNMPELAFAYQIGKEIYMQREEIFPNSKIEWDRETTLGNNSRIIYDLRLKVDNSKDIIISFKMDTDQNKYVSDVKCLNELNENEFEKIFCSLKIQDKKYLDIYYIEQVVPNLIKDVIVKKSFKLTHTIWHTKEYYCQIGVWIIK